MTKEKDTSRFKKPEKRRKIHFSSNPRYERILHHLWKFRYLCVHHLGVLLFLDEKQERLTYKQSIRRSENIVNIRGISKNLNGLWQNNYIAKRHILTKGVTQMGTEKDIWSLDKRGAELLVEKTGLFLDDIAYPPLPKISAPHGGEPMGEWNFLKHHILISDVLVSFHAFSYLQNLYEVLFFTVDKKIEEKFSTLIDGKEKWYGIRPDGFIILEEKLTKKRINLFLEIDRKTERLGYFTQKLEGYYAFQNSGKQKTFLEKLYKENFEILGEPKEEFLKNARVLTITTSDIRAKNMAKATFPLFHNGKGSKMFYYTTDTYFQLSQRKEFVSKITSKPYSKSIVSFDEIPKIGQNIWYAGHQDYNLQKVQIFG